MSLKKDQSGTVYFFNNYILYKNKMSPKEICTRLSLWILNFYLKSYTYLLPFNPIFTYVDPEPESSRRRI